MPPRHHLVATFSWVRSFVTLVQWRARRSCFKVNQTNNDDFTPIHNKETTGYNCLFQFHNYEWLEIDTTCKSVWELSVNEQYSLKCDDEESVPLENRNDEILCHVFLSSLLDLMRKNKKGNGKCCIVNNYHPFIFVSCLFATRLLAKVSIHNFFLVFKKFTSQLCCTKIGI